MSNSGGPLPLKTLRLKPLREEEMMSTVGASTDGVQKLQRRRPPPRPSRRKTKRSLREEGIMKRKRKEKPVLQVLLIAALALNTALSFVVLANRNRMAQRTEKKEPVPALKAALDYARQHLAFAHAPLNIGSIRLLQNDLRAIGNLNPPGHRNQWGVHLLFHELERGRLRPQFAF